MKARAVAVLVLSLAVVWSSAAIAQALDPALPTALPTGQAITWPAAVVTSVWLASQAVRDLATRAQATADRLVDAITRLCDRDKALIRVSVDQCPARFPSEPTGPLRLPA